MITSVIRTMLEDYKVSWTCIMGRSQSPTWASYILAKTGLAKQRCVVEGKRWGWGHEEASAKAQREIKGGHLSCSFPYLYFMVDKTVMYEVFFSFVSNKLFLQMRIIGLFLVNIINSLEDITIHWFFSWRLVT